MSRACLESEGRESEWEASYYLLYCIHSRPENGGGETNKNLWRGSVEASGGQCTAIKRALKTGEEKSWGDAGNILPASERLTLVLPLHTKSFRESSAVQLGPCKPPNLYSPVVTLHATRFNFQQDKTGKVRITWQRHVRVTTVAVVKQ